MTWNPLRTRRLLVRLALLFALGQVIAVLGVLFALPAMKTISTGPVLIIGLVFADLVILAVFSGWIIQGSVTSPLERLSADVHRIADGDFHHRIGDLHRDELLGLRDSVNRLADRLIADQLLLADNVQSLEDTNRELLLVRDQVVRTARLASVGTLAAGIAHEVGNPLGAIIGFVDVARARVEKAGGDVELLDAIRGEAKRIDRIVRGLLDYARPSDPESSASTAGEVVVRVRRLLEDQGKLDQVECAWDVREAGERGVLEAHRLEQVLVNLLLNALHAVRGVQEPRIAVRVSEEDGALLHMPRRREADPRGVDYMHRRRLAQDEAGVGSVATAERLTVIEVSDNGPGIPEEITEHLFDPFFTTKEPGEGTGLGLSICARLVEGMGGIIEAGNRPDGGALFVIRLPAMYDTAESTERS
ncbi:MAG: ATP-binding protein [Gemmatimonadetes bacterium]|nr:ATP-binding protein [Gemmatimonadota bacterium]MDA1103775.1 ATP-binding protein [Gemmatimonadota bacterium]